MNHKSHTEFKRCYHSHPALPIGDYKIYGGSCIDPIVTDADVYVGFDLGMARNNMAYPWEKGESFLFHIQDMGVPKDPEQFKNLIEWLAVQLIANKKVHLGCIGGHGRTGMVLSALVKHMTGEKDAIQYVRKHYCEKVVESASQVKFLMQHFGVSHALGHKEGTGNWTDHDTHGTRTGRSSSHHSGQRELYPSSHPKGRPEKGGPQSRNMDGKYQGASPLKAAPAAPTSIWGSSVIIDKLYQPDTITV